MYLEYENYMMPGSLEEALSMLKEYKGQARIIAGGTDLVIDIGNKKRTPGCLVDITRIDEFKEIRQEGDYIDIGAGVSHNEVAKSQLINEKATALAQGCAEVGSLQIRNVGTVVGNVVNAQPAADAAVALVALGASVKITDTEGTREELVEDVYAGVGTSKIDSSREIATGVKVPIAGANQGSSFVRIAKRNALALPMLNAAAAVSLRGEDIEWARIVMSPVGPAPTRVTEGEKVLSGASAVENKLKEAAEQASQQAQPRSSKLRGSAGYRRSVLKALIIRALKQAVAQAKGE